MGTTETGVSTIGRGAGASEGGFYQRGVPKRWVRPTAGATNGGYHLGRGGFKDTEAGNIGRGVGTTETGTCLSRRRRVATCNNATKFCLLISLGDDGGGGGVGGGGDGDGGNDHSLSKMYHFRSRGIFFVLNRYPCWRRPVHNNRYP